MFKPQRVFLKYCFAVAVSLSAATAVAERLTSAESPKVVASIAPLKLIIEELGAGLIDVDVLLDGTASPHHFNLRMSDVRKIKSADLVLWVGSEMEPYLSKVLKHGNTLAMAEIGNLEQAHDPHYWLDPDNVLKTAEVYTAELSRLLPGQEARLETALQSFKTSLAQADAQLKEKSSASKPFMVFHDSLDHVVAQYRLTKIGVLTDVPEEQVGVRTLQSLLKLSAQASCLITDAGEKREASRYAQRLDLPMAVVDLLASQASYRDYSEYYSLLVSAIFSCEQGNKQSFENNGNANHSH